MSCGEIFSTWLKRKFDLFSEDSRVNILYIDPIFDNKELIETLKKRGLAIAAKDFGQIK